MRVERRRRGRRSLVATAVAVASLVTAGAASADSTFGLTSPGSQSGAPGADIKFGTVYDLTEAGTTVDFRFYATGGAADQTFRPAIYAVDGGGTPTSVVVAGDSATVPSGAAGSWVTVTLPSTALTPGQYLLALFSGPTGSNAAIAYNPVNGAVIYNTDAYPGTPPPAGTPFGAVNHDNQQLSVYVTYRPTNNQADNHTADPTTTQAGPASPPPPPPPPPRGQYCLDGKYVDLLLGQPSFDPAWAGAVPAGYFPGVGLSCMVPAGYAATSLLVNSGGDDLGPDDRGRIYRYFAKVS
jgi:hypothetical protein